jgi:hypothetical protein
MLIYFRLRGRRQIQVTFHSLITSGGHLALLAAVFFTKSIWLPKLLTTILAGVIFLFITPPELQPAFRRTTTLILVLGNKKAATGSDLAPENWTSYNVRKERKKTNKGAERRWQEKITQSSRSSSSCGK